MKHQMFNYVRSEESWNGNSVQFEEMNVQSATNVSVDTPNVITSLISNRSLLQDDYV